MPFQEPVVDLNVRGERGQARRAADIPSCRRTGVDAGQTVKDRPDAIGFAEGRREVEMVLEVQEAVGQIPLPPCLIFLMPRRSRLTLRRGYVAAGSTRWHSHGFRSGAVNVRDHQAVATLLASRVGLQPVI